MDEGAEVLPDQQETDARSVVDSVSSGDQVAPEEPNPSGGGSSEVEDHVETSPDPTGGSGVENPPNAGDSVDSRGEQRVDRQITCPLLKMDKNRSDFIGIELVLRCKGRILYAYVDSGSTANYMNAELARDLNLPIQGKSSRATLADGSVTEIDSMVHNVSVRCGDLKTQFSADLFPNLGYDVILGYPWLLRENPSIDFRSGLVTVDRRQRAYTLPIRYDPPVHKRGNGESVEFHNSIRSFVNAVARDKSVKPIYLAYIRCVEDATETLAAVGGSDPNPDLNSEYGGQIKVEFDDKGDIKDMSKESEVESLIHEGIPNEIAKVLRKYPEVFAKDLPKGVPPVRRGHEFKVDLTDETPIYRPIYKLSPQELAEVKRQVEYLLELGLIRPSESPWGAPILFVPKADGGLRMCVDYRWINRVTVKNRYPLPLPEELIDRLGEAKVFSKLDLRSGYWQLPVRPSDTEKTAFRTRYGHFEFLVAPFGMSNCGAQFQTMVQDILKDFIDDFVVAFIDDILIYSKDMEEHVVHLEKVLKRFADEKLYCKASKCELVKEGTSYLGVDIGSQGLSVQEKKVKAIVDWKSLNSVEDIRSFIGMVSYYRKFIPRFAHIAAPLNDLLKKDTPWRWGEVERNAFEELKRRISRAPILIHPNPEQGYTVITDASDRGLGAVLCQDRGKGLQPIAFLSRRLKPAETRYSTYDKELCALVYAFVQWRHYLEGAKVRTVVYTDHQPLTFLLGQQTLSRTQTRWVQNGMLDSIYPEILYLPGKQNVLADALSRSLPPVASGEKLNASYSEGIDCYDLAESVAAISTLETDKEEWLRACERDSFIRARLKEFREGTLERTYKVEGGLLYKIPGRLLSYKLVVPREFVNRVLKEKHDSPSAGHMGMEKTLELVGRSYWWQRWRQDTMNYVRSCPSCQKNKYETKKPAGELQPIPIPTKKFEQITTDLVTDLPPSSGFDSVVVFVDRLTKYVRFAPCTKNVSATKYAHLFVDTVYRNHGLPSVIISDRDRRFESRFWKELFRILGTDLRKSTAYHPQTDGQSEVMIRTLETVLRPYVERYPTKWSEYLGFAEFAINNSVNSTTGYSPSYLVYGQNPTTVEFLELGKSSVESVNEMVSRMGEALRQAKHNYALAQHSMCKFANRKRRKVDYEVGDKVLIKSSHLPLATDPNLSPKFKRRFVGPFPITERISHLAFRVELPKQWGSHDVFHVSKFKKYIAPSEDREEPAPEPELIDGVLEYEVERILRERGTRSRKEYLVLWKGYDLSEAEWVPESHLDNAREALADFKADQTRRTSRTRGRATRNS